MRKIEIVSLVFVVVAVGVLMIALQMDDASARKWLFMLSVAMLILAMDPKLSLIKKKKVKEVEEPEEDGPGHIYLSSAVSVESVDRKWLDGRDIFLRFLDIESEDDCIFISAFCRCRNMHGNLYGPFCHLHLTSFLKNLE